MKQEHDDSDDLLALARRGDLPEVEERRLRGLLARSTEARLLYEAGRAFDGDAPVVPGDDERVARIERAVQRRLGAERAPQRRWIVQACVAAALVATGAIAAIRLTRPQAATPSGAATEPAAQASAAMPARLAVATPPPSIATSRPPDVGSSETAPPRVVLPTREPLKVSVPFEPPRATSSSSRPEASTRNDGVNPATSLAASGPGELFAAANDARVRGDTAEAARISRELEQRFPSSREAIATHLSLGMLYLQGGQPALALEQFRRFRVDGTSATMPEAMWGESQALRQLGRTDEERATLNQLLLAHPRSAYASAAQKRLADLP